jgi:hypothetical protein
VIANSRQYWVTLEEVEHFLDALEHTDEENTHLSPRLQQAMRDSLNCQLEELLAQVAEYEARTTVRSWAMSLPGGVRVEFHIARTAPLTSEPGAPRSEPKVIIDAAEARTTVRPALTAASLCG